MYGAGAACRDGPPLMGTPAQVCQVPPGAYSSAEKDVLPQLSTSLPHRTEAFTNGAHSLVLLCKLSFI